MTSADQTTWVSPEDVAQTIWFLASEESAGVTGYLMEKLTSLPVFWAAALSGIVGNILLLYALGIPGVSLVAGIPLEKAILGSAIYIPGDLLKVILTGFVAQALWRASPSKVPSFAARLKA